MIAWPTTTTARAWLSPGLGALTLVLVGTVAMLQRDRLAVRRRYAAAALRADSLEAAADTTRAVALRTLGDSQRAWQRRAVQRPQPSDALDRELRLQRVALTELHAEVRGLRAELASRDTVGEDSLGVRRATFAVDSTPYRGSVNVALPASGGRGSLRLDLRIDPAPIGLRVGCGPANADGIRPAAVTATGPRWLSVTLDRVEQEPGLCRSPALEPARRRWFDRVGIWAGYGATATPGGEVRHGVQIGAGLGVRPRR